MVKKKKKKASSKEAPRCQVVDAHGHHCEGPPGHGGSHLDINGNWEEHRSTAPSRRAMRSLANKDLGVSLRERIQEIRDEAYNEGYRDALKFFKRQADEQLRQTK
jgi:hypothetical protein